MISKKRSEGEGMVGMRDFRGFPKPHFRGVKTQMELGFKFELQNPS